MRTLTQTPLFNILSSAESELKLTDKQLQGLLDEFAEIMAHLNCIESDPAALFRTLSYTRIHLHTLQGELSQPTEAGKKCA